MITSQAELIEYHKQLTEQARSLMERKNSDYANAGGDATTDPFKNFRIAEHLGLCRAEDGVLVRLTDKISRLATFVERGDLKVKDESVRDTIIDVINYVVIFGALCAERQENE